MIQCAFQRERLGSPDSRVLDGEDLLDDVLTTPSNLRRQSQTPTNEDEVSGFITWVLRGRLHGTSPLPL